ncbi:MAG TPA: hypothetical protein VFM51_01175 [Solirubrobacterales bacterium]|nr:hypothetical protein [Solirubrobacterales bacterium]
MARRSIHTSLVASLILLGLALAPSAQATFHIVQIREVYPGSAANPQSEYVELQMWQSGENLVGGHFLRGYDAAGTALATSTMPSNVPNGANQSTFLLATPQAEAQFGIAADASLAPAGQLSPSGGAVCWEGIDCVAWGAFAGTLPSPTGAPAVPAGIPDGKALRRSIARGCSSLLDFEDDRDRSAADFATASPAPRPNSVAPIERRCPQTILRLTPAKRTGDRTPTFRFNARGGASRFQCKLDRGPFRSCRSPSTTRPLALGPHRFRVRAIGSQGNADPSPASYRFRVIRRG